MLRWWFLTLAFLAAAPAECATLSQAEATIEADMAKQTMSWDVGRIRVVNWNCDPQCGKRTVSKGLYLGTYDAMARRGFMTIKVVAQSPDDAVIQVDLTPEAKRHDISKDPEKFEVTTGKHPVTEIVEMRPVDLGVADGRVVLFVYSVESHPHYAKIMGDDRPPYRMKGRMLLQYDPFAKSWVRKAADFAAPDQEFWSSYVQQELMRQGAKPPNR